MTLANAVIEVNEAQPGQVLDILQRDLGSVAGRKILVLGLAFKPDTDDVRESASLKIIELLVVDGARVTAHDPIAADNFKRALGRGGGKVALVEDWKAEVPNADAIIVATKWREYEALTAMDLGGKILLDARRMFQPAAIAGAVYRTIGRRIG
jgi:UDPglucose 6-dehydrogenase/GDP-mannose 6-dehydrogenase